MYRFALCSSMVHVSSMPAWMAVCFSQGYKLSAGYFDYWFGHPNDSCRSSIEMCKLGGGGVLIWNLGKLWQVRIIIIMLPFAVRQKCIFFFFLWVCIPVSSKLLDRIKWTGSLENNQISLCVAFCNTKSTLKIFFLVSGEPILWQLSVYLIHLESICNVDRHL